MVLLQSTKKRDIFHLAVQELPVTKEPVNIKSWNYLLWTPHLTKKKKKAGAILESIWVEKLIILFFAACIAGHFLC